MTHNLWLINIIEKPFLAFGDFEIADDMKQSIVDEMNKYSEIFQFKNTEGEPSSNL